MQGRRKRSVNVPGLEHVLNPIPLGSRVGNMLFSSGILGQDRETGRFPPDIETQAENAFRNLSAFMTEAGGTLEDVGFVWVYIRNQDARPAVNAAWSRWFPDPDDRPARHVLTQDLLNEMLVQLVVIAVIED